MAQPVRVRTLTEQEGQKLQRIVRRSSTSTVRFRRAMMLQASAGGNTVPVIARLAQADEDTVRDVIHKFNQIGLTCLDPLWAGGRPRLLSDDDEDFVIQTATTRPVKLGQPFTRWSVRKLAEHLRRDLARPIRIGREAPRCLLARRGITFQRTRPGRSTPTRTSTPSWTASSTCSTSARTGPSPSTSSGLWASSRRPGPAGPSGAGRLPAAYHRTRGTRYFHGCYSVGDDTLWGVNRRRKGIGPTWAALKSIRAARPDGAPVYPRHLDVLAAQRRERARIRSEKGIRWGGRPLAAAA